MQRSLGIQALATVFLVAGLEHSASASTLDFSFLANYLGVHSSSPKSPTAVAGTGAWAAVGPAALANNSLLPGSIQPVAAKQTPAPATPGADATPQSRALPSPLDNPPFPTADWAVNGYTPIGESWDATTYALQKAIFGKKDSRIKVYGWLDAGIGASPATNSNSPYAYALQPNRVELDQLVLRVEQMPDTVQKDHTDWGFRVTGLYGIDYRFTAAAGYFSDQLFKRNSLYGFDPVEMFGMVYIPKIQQGTVIQFGRYISPPDIEAQLAPQNYLYSHSLMFDVDPYTYTGVNAQIRYSPTFTLLVGVHAGNDQAPWAKSASPNAEIMVGINSKDNKDSLWTGLDSIGKGKYSDNHDQLQIATATWGHKFSNLWHMQTQSYYMWEYDAAIGGTAINGPNTSYASGGGAGAIIPGMSHANGFVNYLEYKINKDDYATFRSDFLNDPQGWRTGFKNRYTSFTLGYSHFFNAVTQIRPEIDVLQGYDNAAFDLGTRKSLVVLGCDVIYKF